jgi:hypothetical protein
MLQKLRGRRTYIVGWLMFVSAGLLWLLGLLPGADAIHWTYEALGLMGLRAGVNRIGNPDLAALVQTLLDRGKTDP